MKRMLLSVGMILLLGACAPAPESTMNNAATEAQPTAPMTEEAMTEAPMTEEVMTEEPMTEEVMTPDAMWCPNCKRQQQEVQALHAALGEMGADLVSLGLDIDPNENAADLKAYTDANGFDWLYAVAPPDVSRSLSELYGDQFLNPPSTPMLVIDRHGQVHPLPFGIKDAETLKETVAPFLNEGM